MRLLQVVPGTAKGHRVDVRAAAAQVPATEAQGQLLGGRYELRSVIAKGGMGRVWRAWDTLLERPVAVKVLRSEFTGDATFLTRFRTEARHAALLSDPNIATVHDYGEAVDPDGGEHIAYLVMELVDGDPLSVLRRRALGLGVDRTLRIVWQTASALAAAHAVGVVHRDVKPANVLVTPDGLVKLTDFGIAWSAASVALTRTGQVMGTAHYLAPEQVEGARATAASDVYSLGVVAYECLAGRRPFEGENSVQTALKHIREIPPPLPADVPDDVRALVAHAMARNPADRLPDGAAVRDAVGALLEARGTAPTDSQPTTALTAAVGPPGTAAAPATEPADTLPTLPEAGVLPPAGDLPSDEEPSADGEPSAGEEPVARRRWPMAVPLAAGGALMGLVVLAGVLFAPSDTPRTMAATPPPATTTATAGTPASASPATVRVDREALVGRPADQVRAELTAAGLSVAMRGTETTAVRAGQVISVDPWGEVPPGALVTVVYATAPPAAPTPAGTPDAPAATAPPAATSAAPAATSTSAGKGRPGRGHGNGRDKPGPIGSRLDLLD